MIPETIVPSLPNLLGYIIGFTIPDDPVIRTLYIDDASGGYLCVCKFTSLKNLKLFGTFEEAKTFLETDSDMIRFSEMSNGDIDPPRIVYSALGLNNSKRGGTLHMFIIPLMLGKEHYVTSEFYEVTKKK